MSVIAGMKKLFSRTRSAKSQSGETHAEGQTEQQNTAGQENLAYISKPESPSNNSQPMTDGTSQDEVAVAAAEPEAKSKPVEKASLLPPYDGPVLEVRNVHRSFQTGSRIIHVLKGIDMEVNPQQLVMLKGRSGSGKTTLLNMLGGLDQPSSGDILFSGQPLQDWGDRKRTSLRRKEIGFIFQAYALMPLLSAWENVELSLRMADVPRSEWKERVGHCLDLVGLTKRVKHRPFEMSGGEQQRVAIAKAIAHRPRLLLADEPTAELDSKMGAQVMAVFRNIIEVEQVTICMTTHDPTILEVADHVYEMADGRFIK
nr:ABC transporter ATP-binding protein [Paenibacillus xylanilyticus]